MPKLLEQVREVLRMKHYSLRTEQAYVDWIKRYIFFHDKRHPGEMSEDEIRAFISDLASKKQVSASTQTVALSAPVSLPRRAEKGSAIHRWYRARQATRTTARGLHASRSQRGADAAGWRDLPGSGAALRFRVEANGCPAFASEGHRL